MAAPSFHSGRQRPVIQRDVAFVSWLWLSGHLTGCALQYLRVEPSEIGIAGMLEAFAPTGEFPLSGGWKPITLKSFLRHSGSGLSGRPPSEPFRLLKRATRFIISSRLQVRMLRQSFMSSSSGEE